LARTARIFPSAAAIASTLSADNLRPDGGMFEAGTGIGASEFVDWPEDAVPETRPGPAAKGDRREVPEIVVEAAAEAGSAHRATHAMRISERLTTRE